MKKKFLSIIILYFLSSTGINAQLQIQFANWNAANQQYGAAQPFATESILSDYGMRISDVGTRFHQGIDYNGTVGSAIVSLTAGRVTSISESNGNGNRLKKIVINGQYGLNQQNQLVITDPNGPIFAYLHIFNDNLATDVIRSGGFIMRRVEGNLVIINIGSGVALCEISGLQFTQDQVQYTTTNFVNAGQFIAPLGTSGGIGAHLHVSLLEDRTEDRHLDRSIDPWNRINNPNTILNTRIRRREDTGFQRHVCEFDQGTQAWGTCVINYANDTRNVLEAEVSMPNAAAQAQCR